MDTADDLALQQNQEEAQRSKYALLRPSVPLGSECLVRVFFLNTLDQPQQLVVASTVPVERIQDRKLEIGTRSGGIPVHAVPAAAEHPAGGLHHQANGARHPAPRTQVLEFPVRR